MQKQAPSLGRLAVMVGFALSCFGLLLFLWLAFGGAIPLKPKGYRFSVSFPQANQLAQEADVRISGVSVGKVKSISVQPNGYSNVTIELNRRYAPIPRDSSAILRQKTLLGETYVELTPGQKSSGLLPEGATLPASQVASSVALDQIFRALDAPTRQALQVWLQTLAASVNGRGRDISDTLGTLAPFAQDANTLAMLLNAQQPEVRRVVRNTGAVFAALSERDAQLRSVITNTNTVFQTTAQRNRELAQTFVALPTFEHESTLTVNRLARFATTTNPLITQLRPAARQLSPTLISLSKLAPNLRGLFRDLGPLITASKAGLPALERFTDELHPLLAELTPLLHQVNPIVSFLGLYRRELTSFFANVVAATEATDLPAGSRTPVHYLRTTNPLNPENLAAYPRRIGSNRPNPYGMPGIFDALPTGMPQYETRQCANGVPTLASGLTNLIPDQLRKQIQQFAFAANGTVPAPPCKQQGPYNFSGQVTLFPHVNALP
ncbi:MAG TPA: MlaD family protein [Solirubrobacteraceae bacterium]|nr:MlaD family protein [Solirubrobacteraceae bacterium]